MTYITKVANKKVLVEVFFFILQINYFNSKLNASRSIFSCCITFYSKYVATACELHFQKLQLWSVIMPATNNEQK